MREPTAQDILNDKHHAPLVITAKGQCVSVLEVTDYGVSAVRYPNGRQGTLPTGTLSLVEGA